MFEDSTVESGQLLISAGAGGAHSVMKEYLVQLGKAALTMSPLVASAAMAKLFREEMGSSRGLPGEQ